MMKNKLNDYPSMSQVITPHLYGESYNLWVARTQTCLDGLDLREVVEEDKFSFPENFTVA